MTDSVAGLLKEKVALITGASAGLGLVIAKKFLRAGASVTVCARDQMRLDQACAMLRQFAGVGQSVFGLSADVSRESDVHRLVETTLSRYGQIDVLVNNAGIYGAKGAVEQTEWTEWQRAVEVNLFGSILLCRAVLAHFKQQRRGKIVQLSGGGASAPLPMLSAYAVSKAAIVRFVETLAEETRTYNIDVNAIAPGALNTAMLDEIIAAGAGKVGDALYQRSLEQKRDGGASLEHAADLAVFLSSSRSDGITGKLLSAVWDPWARLPEHLQELRGTDVYTLRRVTPRDRDLDWGNED